MNGIVNNRTTEWGKEGYANFENEIVIQWAIKLFEKYNEIKQITNKNMKQSNRRVSRFSLTVSLPTSKTNCQQMASELEFTCQSSNVCCQWI